jgi:hypothetical protein
VEGSCEYGNEPSVYIKFCEIIEKLGNWRLLKKGSVPWGLYLKVKFPQFYSVTVFIIMKSSFTFHFFICS